MKKIKVITAVYSGRNERATLNLSKQVDYDNVEYIVYTNDPNLNVYPWKTIVDYDMSMSDRLNARRIKTNIHKLCPDAEYWFWIDSYFKINSDPNILIDKYLQQYDVVVLPHPERNNIIEEASIIQQWLAGKQDENVVEAMEKYDLMGYVPISLYETGIAIFRNTKQIRTVLDDWWQEVRMLSIRDQLSFPYVAWKNGLAVNTFPGTYSRQPLRYKLKPYLKDWQEVSK